MMIGLYYQAKKNEFSFKYVVFLQFHKWVLLFDTFFIFSFQICSSKIGIK